MPDTPAKRRPRRPLSPTQKLIDVSGATERYGPPPSTWRGFVNAGALPYVRLGRKLWFRVADVEALIARQTEVR